MWKFTYALYRTSVWLTCQNTEGKPTEVNRCLDAKQGVSTFEWQFIPCHTRIPYILWNKPRGFSDFAPEQTRKFLRAPKSFSGQGSHLVSKSEVQALVLIQGEEETELCSLTRQVPVLNIERSLSNFTWNSSLETRYYSNESFHRQTIFVCETIIS